MASSAWPTSDRATTASTPLCLSKSTKVRLKLWGLMCLVIPAAIRRLAPRSCAGGSTHRWCAADHRRDGGHGRWQGRFGRPRRGHARRSGGQRQPRRSRRHTSPGWALSRGRVWAPEGQRSRPGCRRLPQALGGLGDRVGGGVHAQVPERVRRPDASRARDHGLHAALRGRSVRLVCWRTCPGSPSSSSRSWRPGPRSESAARLWSRSATESPTSPLA